MLEDNLKQFDAVTARQRAIYERKNHDYGDSFSESLDEWGPVAFVVRADDKMRRIKQLIITQAKVPDESLRDTVSDLANYCVMFLMKEEPRERHYSVISDPAFVSGGGGGTPGGVARVNTGSGDGDSNVIATTCFACGKEMPGGRINGLRCAICQERGEWGL